jgi:peptide/nickel transport system ATP-binding protein
MSISVRVKLKQRTIINIPKFDLADKKINFLFGESGIGKTMLAKSMFGLLDQHHFSVDINGMNYEDYQQSELCRAFLERGFFVFQEPSTHLNPIRRLSSQLAEGSLHNKLDSKPFMRMLWKKDSEEIISDILPLFPRPYRPSGGEKQRILLAMAFKKLNILFESGIKPSLFVFDEPTGNLDDAYRNLFLHQLFKHYNKQPFTVLFITHDYSIISQIKTHFASMLSHIRYYEAQSVNQHTHITEFLDSAYLDWLETLSPSQVSTELEKCQLLNLESTIRVFGRKFNISQGQSANMKLDSGQIIYLKAESGTGKTTLAKVIMGLIRPEYLRLKISNIDFSEDSKPAQWKRQIWGKSAAMVFQHADEALNLSSSVRAVFDGLPGAKQMDDNTLLIQLRDYFDLSFERSFLDRKVSSLSGGQKQKLNLMRALMTNPQILILDEPFNGLDLGSLKKIVHLLQQKQAHGMGILLISHNEEIIDKLVPTSSQYQLSTDNTD